MIITIEEYRSLDSRYAEMTDDDCIEQIKAIESLIRDYTHNNFQNRKVRFRADISGGAIAASCSYLKAGDNVQISESMNDGTYTVASSGDTITLMEDVYDEKDNLITKVEYPAAVRAGVKALLTWKATGGEKVGIKQESISRHSVTYYDQDVNNTVMGYPVALMAFLEPYFRARF